MRLALVAVGAVVVIVGVALWVVPLTPESSSKAVPYGYAYDFGVPGSIVVGSIPYHATWTLTSDGNATIYACGTNSGAGCPIGANGTVIAQASGSSGSASWTGKAGDWFLFVSDTGANITVDYKEPVGGGWVGLAFLGAGVLIVVAGLATRSKPKRASPPRAEKSPPPSG